MGKSVFRAFNEQPTLEEGFDNVYTKCEAKNYAQKTLINYKNVWKIFKVYINELEEKEKKTYDFKSINQKVMTNFIKYLQNSTSTNDVSINSYMRTIRAIFYKFMSDDCQYLERFTIIVPSYEETYIEPYTEEEINLLITKQPKKTDIHAYRDWVIVCFIYDTLSRLKNVTKLKIKDVDVENGVIMFKHSKGKKLHIVPMSETLVAIMREYMYFRNGESDDYLFCQKDGKPISESGLQSALNRYNKRHGLNTTGIHRLRHTGAKDMVTNEVPEAVIQQLLGHSTRAMTSRYTKLFGDKSKHIVDKKSPLTMTKQFERKSSFNIN